MAKRQKLGATAPAAGQIVPEQAPAPGSASASSTTTDQLIGRIHLPTTPTPAAARSCTFIYGVAGIGKSTFASRSPSPLFLATEPLGSHIVAMSVYCTSWERLIATIEQLELAAASAPGGGVAGLRAAGLPYKTLVLDTVDGAYRFCSEYVCRRQEISHESELDHGAGYGMITSELLRAVTRLSAIGLPLYLLAHAKSVGRLGADRMVPAISETPRRMLLGMCDVALFADVDEAGKHVCYSKPSRKWEAKDCTGRLPEVMPFKYKVFAGALDGGGGEMKTAETAKAAAETAAPAKVVPDRAAKAITHFSRYGLTQADLELKLGGMSAATWGEQEFALLAQFAKAKAAETKAAMGVGGAGGGK
jgi:hypothetical protein